MTLAYELGVDILKMYRIAKNEVYRSRLSKVKSANVTDRYTEGNGAMHC